MHAKHWVGVLLAVVVGGANAGGGFDADGLREISPLGPDDNGTAGALAMGADGRLVVAGTAAVRGSVDAPRLIVRRFAPDGSDASPSQLLSLQHAGSLSVPARGLLVDDLSRVFVAYNLADATSPEDGRGLVVQVGPGGGLPSFTDFTFDPTLFGDALRAIAMDLRRRLVVAGSSRATDGSGATVGVVLRLTATGQQDMAFGGDGSARINGLDSPNVALRFLPDVFINSVLLHADGRITVVGTASNPVSNESELLVLRLREDGRRDPDFNGGEPLLYAHRAGTQVATTTAGNAADMAPDGTLVVAARTVVGGTDRACLWQFSPDGVFQGGPCADFGAGDAAVDVLLLPNGGVLGMARFSDGGVLRTTLGFFADGLPFSGGFDDRFPAADRNHFPAAIAYDPDRRQVIGLSSGVRVGDSGLVSQRWVLSRDAVLSQSGLDVAPDPVDFGPAQQVLPGAVVQSPVQDLAGFDAGLRLPLRIVDGAALVDGVRFPSADPAGLFFIGRDAATPSLPLQLEHVAGAQAGDTRRTGVALGGFVRASNLALTQGAAVQGELLSGTVEPVDLFEDGFEGDPPPDR